MDPWPAGRAAPGRDPRRTLAAALVAVPAAWALHDLAAAPGAWWSIAGSLLGGVLAGALLAGYVAPRGSGRLLTRGCAPCAIAPAGAVVLALLVLDSTPTPGGMLLAVGALGLGLVQRRLPAATCAAQAPPPGA